MIVVQKIEEMQKIALKEKANGKRIGFVPTMGYLHDGHKSLIERARVENDVVVVSIFVNPMQFGPNEDYEKYPQNFERDQLLAKEKGADILFYPTKEEVYPSGFKTLVEVEKITDKLCGASRPGHFKGVTTIVNKLFNIVMPDKAYFGQKDAQQVLIIKKMVEDLNMHVEVVACPIIREKDGLALSSRNVYLNKEARKASLILNKSLCLAKKMIENGERNAARIKEAVINSIIKEPIADIDYVEVVNYESLDAVEKLEGNILIALAVKIQKVRLIDNLRITV